MSDLLADLNEQQKQAVTHKNGPLLIVAGAGTGKTTVITKRLAWLILNNFASPEQVLAMTFTDKAAGEMEERVDRLLPYGYVDLWVSTFHAFCERVLKTHAIDIGLSTDFKLLNQTEQWLLVRQNLEKFNLDYYRPLGNPTKFIHALLKHFSRAKDEAVRPSDYLEYVKGLKLDTDAPDVIARIRQLAETKQSRQLKSEIATPRQDVEARNDDILRLEEVANAYHVYQQLLLDNNALDFGDLINYTLELFQKRPKILEQYRRQFKYILVDEFQDTNWAQYELIKMLAAPADNLAVVGDDDQCLPAEARITLRAGVKKIADVEIGDEVLTAVGKGHIGVSKVKKVLKNKKQTVLLKIKTAGGREVVVTDNHKMFCYVPAIADKKHYYVYLMYCQRFGWRIGTTNDLASRLRLERSADKIIGLRVYKNETESRYYETLWSLKYGIPTACFKERRGIVIKNELVEKLYKELNVTRGVERLAADLNIDLQSHHCCLAGVYRGDKSRIKINVEMCQGRYRSKDHVKKGKMLILNSAIAHAVSLETSDREVAERLKKNGFKMTRAKKGWRLRILNSDIKKIGSIARRLQGITGGFLEYKCKIGKLNYQTLGALIMPAKNLLAGHYVPVRVNNEIVYDKIVSIARNRTKIEVYDLEIDKTHNFIADNVVVHNSIYKFRGASVSNILQFKKDYPSSKEIVLVKNYRNKQNILDTAYNFIQQNNPYRLEYKLKSSNLSKKLSAQTGTEGIFQEIVAEDYLDEAKKIAATIIDLHKKDKEASWNDYAVLVRANSYAEPLMKVFSDIGLPFNFVASRGLYAKTIVMDTLAYLKLLDNYHESPALYRVLNLPIFALPAESVIVLNHYAFKKSVSLYEALKNAPLMPEIPAETRNKINELLAMIGKHTALARTANVGKVTLAFLEDSGYLKKIVNQDSQQAQTELNFLRQFYKKIQNFETAALEPTVKNFMEAFKLELEAGEEGSLENDLEQGPEAVKIMTIHSAKGLEFRYVFLANMVDKRFPSAERRDPIELPTALIKEILPEGDVHLQEERRLFYVALTRAKEGVFLTRALDYGGARVKKPSRFLYELGLVKEEIKKQTKKKESTDDFQKREPVSAGKSDLLVHLPPYFSYTQYRAFKTCPLQYKFAHILKIPVQGRAPFSFGHSLHRALYDFYHLLLEQNQNQQAGLFGAEGGKKQNIPTLEDLLAIYKKQWVDDWYDNAAQKKDYFVRGEKTLKLFYEQNKNNFGHPVFLEQPFFLKFSNCTVKGAIDRIDDLGDNTVEIIDYKTGKAKDEETLDEAAKEQLVIYQIACQELLKRTPARLTFYYLESGVKLPFLGADKDKEKTKNNFEETFEKIKHSDFSADPSPHKCKFCDFKEICEFREL